MAKTIGFQIVVQGTQEQQKKIADLRGELDRLTRQRKVDAKAVKDKDGLDRQANQQLATTEKRLKEARLAFNRATRAVDTNAKAFDNAKGSYFELQDRNNKLLTQLRQLPNAFDKNNKAAARLRTEIAQNTEKLKQFDAGVGQNFRNVGNYEGAIKSAAGSLGKLAIGLTGVTLGVNAVAGAVKESITVFAQFEREQAKVGTISGASAKELRALEQQALELGATTERTAKEVSTLQLELAKLGFDPKQISDATDSILSLSIAFDEDLGQTATTVGAAIRAFGLEASDASRVADVFAKASASSALDLSKLQTSLGTVAPVAASFGFSIEETTALLGTLVDAGFDASSAATATRNIFLNLADSSGALAKELGGPVNTLPELLAGLNKLESQGIDLNKALELTDKRSVAAFSTFIAATDRTDKLANALNNAEGTAQAFAEQIGQTTQGEIDRTSSAIEGLQIALGERLSGAFQSVLRGVQDAANGLRDWLTVPLSEQLREQQIELNVLAARITDVNTTEEDRIKLLNQLETQFPDVLEGLDAQTVTNEELAKSIETVNKKIVEQIVIQKQQEKIAEAAEEVAEVIEKRAKTELILREQIVRANELEGISINTVNTSLADQVKELQNVLEANARFETNVRTGIVTAANEEAKILSTVNVNALVLRNQINDLNAANSQLAEVTGTANAVIEELDSGFTSIGGVDGGGGSAGSAAGGINKVTEAIEEFDRKVAESVTSTAELEEQRQILLDESLESEIQRFETGLEARTATNDVILDAERKRIAEEQKLNKKAAEDRVKQITAVSKTAAQVSAEVGAILGDTSKSIQEKQREIAKTLVKAGLQAAKNQALIAATNATVGSLASPQSIATGGTAGLVQAGILVALIEGAFAALESAITSSFALGGILPAGGGVITGRSHSQGGVKFMAGGRLNEAEGGEIILTKGVTRDPVLRGIASDINVMGGGRRFQEGGVTSVNRDLISLFNGQKFLNPLSALPGAGSVTANIGLTRIAEKLNEKIDATRTEIGSLQVQVVESDITETQNNVEVNESLVQF